MKRFYADDSAATSVKVGYRQASYKKKTPQKCGVFFRSRFCINREVFFVNGLRMLIDFHFSRHDREELATDFDAGEIDMHIGQDLISSRKRTHMPNIIYMALYDLMDGVVSLQNGAKSFQMHGSHGAFPVHFHRTIKGIAVTYEERKYGPVALAALLGAIERGLAEFFADPLNALPARGAMEDDFLVSWGALKQATGQFGQLENPKEKARASQKISRH